MSEDRLLRELGHLAKEEEDLQAELDERWDRLAAGTLTAEEQAQLEALAAESAEAHGAYEAFRPLGEGFEARMVDRLSAEIEGHAPLQAPGSRLPWFFRFRRAGWWTAATAAAAAVLFLVVRGPSPATMPPLPSYVAELSGGTRTFRGEGSPAVGPRTFAPGDWFQVVLRPASKAPGKGLDARCFLLRRGDLRPLESRVQVDPGGAVKLEGSMARDLEPGEWTLWAVVGRQGELPQPSDPRFLGARVEIRQADWVAVPHEIRIQSHFRSRSP